MKTVDLALAGLLIWLVPSVAVLAQSSASGSATPPAKVYQPKKVKTKVQDGVSKSDALPAAEVHTALGDYKKQISEAIGSRWYYLIKRRNEQVAVGRARAHFVVTKDGRIQDFRLVENTSNEAFAEICAQSVRDAELPAPSPEAVEAMKNGRIEIGFTFSLHP